MLPKRKCRRFDCTRSGLTPFADYFDFALILLYTWQVSSRFLYIRKNYANCEDFAQYYKQYYAN